MSDTTRSWSAGFWKARDAETTSIPAMASLWSTAHEGCRSLTAATIDGGDMVDWRGDRVQAAIDGRNPTVLAELDASFAVIGDVQFLPGYALALSKSPGVDRLSDLPRPERVRYLADVDLVATAVESVCVVRDGGYRRVNVEILGNTDAFLHAHVWPRYDWEPADIVSKAVWLYPAERWHDPATALGPDHDELRADLASEVDRLRNSVEFRFNV